MNLEAIKARAKTAYSDASLERTLQRETLIITDIPALLAHIESLHAAAAKVKAMQERGRRDWTNGGMNMEQQAIESGAALAELYRLAGLEP